MLHPWQQGAWCGPGGEPRRWLYRRWKAIAVVLFLVVSFTLLGTVAYGTGMPRKLCLASGIGLVMVALWISEALPIGVTSLLPAALLPVFGVASSAQIAAAYFSDPIVLFFSMCIVARAIETQGLHRHVALGLLLLLGRGHKSVLLGFILATAFVSMWLSNTVTATVMFPVQAAVFQALEHTTTGGRVDPNFKTAVCLGIALSATIGGFATLTGTGPCIVLQGVMVHTFGTEHAPTYAQWFGAAAPLSLCLVISLWVLLCLLFLRKQVRTQDMATTGSATRADSDAASAAVVAEQEETDETRRVLRRAYHELGPLTYAQKSVLCVFLLLLFMWVGRKPPGAADSGWVQMLLVPEYVSDGTCALLAALALFMLPREPPKLCSRGWHMWCTPYRYEQTNDASPAADMNVADRHSPTTATDGAGDGASGAGDAQLDVVEVKFELEEDDLEMVDLSGGDGGCYPGGGSDAQISALDAEDSDNGGGGDDDDSDSSSKNDDHVEDALLPWSTVHDVPWHIIFLLGGGFALSVGFQEAGVASFIGSALESGSNGHGHGEDSADDLQIGSAHSKQFQLLVVVCVCLAVTMSNFISNIACANILLSALVCTAPAMGGHPMWLLGPLTVGCSLGFLLVIATPANAIGLASKGFTTLQFLKVGALLTPLALLLVVLHSALGVWEWLFPLAPQDDDAVDDEQIPSWLTDSCA